MLHYFMFKLLFSLLNNTSSLIILLDYLNSLIKHDKNEFSILSLENA